ncbi:MAG: hypothetical protein GY716_06770 [bacterium]|nr:hypothetical protein [bacterium]
MSLADRLRRVERDAERRKLAKCPDCPMIVFLPTEDAEYPTCPTCGQKPTGPVKVIVGVEADLL